MIYRKDLRTGEYAPYYEAYINSIPEQEEMMILLQKSLDNTLNLVSDLEKPFDHRYQPEKWSVGQVLTHCIDTERVFSYRALSFMRGDNTDLPGFDQDVYSDGLRNFAFAKANLLQSIEVVRNSTIDLFANATPESLTHTGVANQNQMSVRAIPFVICGHWKHHLDMIVNLY